MKVRLTGIALDTGEEFFEIGRTLVAGEHASLETLTDLVNRQLAEISHGEGVAAHVAAAIDAWRAATLGMQNATKLLADLAEAGSIEDVRAVIAAMSERANPDFLPVIEQFNALEVRLAEADRAALEAAEQQQSQAAGGDAGGPAEAGVTAPGSGAGGEDDAPPASPPSDSGSGPVADEPAAAPQQSRRGQRRS